MKVISVMNLKGGVGKTTTVVNMAAILAREYGKRVMVIDCDPQGNTTDFFGVRDKASGVFCLLSEQDSARYGDVFADTLIPEVSVVPASTALIYSDIAALKDGENGRLTAIRDFCQDMEEEGGVDFVLIDCPPSFTAASCAAIMASEDIIIPVKPDGFVFSGVNELLAQIRGLRTVNPTVNVKGLLVTMWHNSEAVKAGVAALERIPVPVFETKIRRTDKVDESTYARETLDRWSPYSSAGRDYKAFVAEYMGV